MKVLFLDGTTGFSPTRIDTRPSGGIITSLTKIPKYLAQMGLDVSVVSAYQKDDEVDGVKHLTDLSSIDPDVVVYNRNLINNYLVNFYPRAKKIWWLHDIVDHRYLEDDACHRVDKVVSLSDYCTRSFSDYYSIERSRFIKIPNGVDKSIFCPTDQPRNKNLFLMASAPIKGMYPISFTWFNLKRNNPNAELRLYCSQKLHDQEETETMGKLITGLRKEGVSVFNPVNQAQLAELMKQAWGFLMPNHYPEICSNVLLQARACGCPVIASNIGSADEFIDHGVTGLLTKTVPHDMYWWHKDFAELTVRLSGDKILHDRLSFNAPNGIMSWQDVAQKWYNLLGDLYGNRPISKISEKLHI